MLSEKPISGAPCARTSSTLATPARCDPPPALRDGILDKIGNETAHQLMNGTNGFKARIERRDLAAKVTQKIDLARFGQNR